MKRIITKTVSAEYLIQILKLQIDEQRDYILIENGLEPISNEINIYFDPNNLNEVKDRLMRIGYYNFYNDLLVCKKNDEIHLVNLNEIIYIEGVKADVFVHTSGGEYKSKDTLKNLEFRLYEHKFIRVSKGYIVSLYHIKKIKTTFGNGLVILLKNNQEIPVTKHYSPNFKRILNL